MGLLLLTGCATAPVPPAAPKAVKRPEVKADVSLAERYRKKAEDQEQKGEIRKAILYFELAYALNPSDLQLSARIQELKSRSRALSEKHFESGTAHFAKNEYLEARKAFLLSLYYNPEKTEALHYLKEKIPGEVFTAYSVREGDTLDQIASTIYYDPGKAALIAYFNDLGKTAPLVPGTVLKLPVVDWIDPQQWVDTEGYFTGISESPESMLPETAPPEASGKKVEGKETALAAAAPSRPLTPSPVSTSEIDREIARAEGLFKSRRYLEVVGVSERILVKDPGNSTARGLLNESGYQAGKMMLASKAYDRAIVMFEKVERDYKDAVASKALAERNMADFHYLAGLRFFINEEVEKAIREWETTLSLNPRHTKAERDLENARMVLRKLKEIQ